MTNPTNTLYEQVAEIIEAMDIPANLSFSEERKKQAKAKLTNLIQQSELYGRLHETVEHFQKGQISAEFYSQRHTEIVEKITQLQEVL